MLCTNCINFAYSYYVNVGYNNYMYKELMGKDI